jgi:hypothetical protein
VLARDRSRPGAPPDTARRPAPSACRRENTSTKPLPARHRGRGIGRCERSRPDCRLNSNLANR